MNNNAVMPFYVYRSTLMWLCIAYWLLIIPLYQELIGFIYIGCLFAIGLRFAIEFGYFKEPRRFFVAGLAVCGTILIAIFGWRHGMLNAMLNVLVLGCALKFLEFRSKRDLGFHLLSLFFLCGVTFVYHQKIGISLFLLVVGLLNVTALLSIYYPKSYLKQWQKSAELLFQSVPLMLLLFLFIPRLGPLWLMPEAKSAQTGMSDSMSPGDFSKLSRSSELVFRATFDGPPPAERYWRALVLEQFDGRSWRVAPQLEEWMQQARFERAISPSVTVKQKAINYSVILEPQHSHWFYALYLSLPTSTELTLTPFYGLYSPAATSQKQQYSLSWYPDQLHTATLDPISRKQNLQLPEHGNPRAREWVGQLQQRYSDKRQLADAIMRYFNTEPFYYTLEPPLLGRDAIDQFLFSTRQGFCEHFASSFSFLMRQAGIPSRVVVGYLGGEYYPDNNYFSVYQFDAHAWVELWFDSQGWVRFDPTAMVAPQRINNSLDVLFDGQGFSAQDPLSLVRYRQVYWVNAVRTLLSDIDYRWSVWVLNFDNNKQHKLLSAWFGEGRISRILGFLLALLLAVFVSIFVGWMIRGRAKRDPLLVAYQSCCRKLTNLGMPSLEGETALQYAQRLTETGYQNSRVFEQITQLFVQQRYQDYTQHHNNVVIGKIRRLKRLL